MVCLIFPKSFVQNCSIENRTCHWRNVASHPSETANDTLLLVVKACNFSFSNISLFLRSSSTSAVSGNQLKSSTFPWFLEKRKTRHYTSPLSLPCALSKIPSKLVFICVFFLAKANAFLIKGNEICRGKDFSEAIRLYTEGIAVNCKDELLKAKLYSNRAKAHFSLGELFEPLSMLFSGWRGEVGRLVQLETNF